MRSKLLYLLPCLLLFLTACPGGKEEENPTPAQGCLLVEQQVETTGKWPKKPRALYRYTYNSQQQLTTVAVDSVFSSSRVNVETYKLHYNQADHIERLEVTPKNGFGLISRIDYEYNSQHQLIKQSRHLQKETGEWLLQDYYMYQYNNKGDRQYAKYHDLELGIYKLRYIMEYTYTNGNPTHIVKHSITGVELGKATFTYDDKPASQLLLPLEFGQPEDFMPALNNIQSATWSGSNGTEKNYTVQYTYNENGYPTAATKTYSWGKTEISSAYTCAK